MVHIKNILRGTRANLSETTFNKKYTLTNDILDIDKFGDFDVRRLRYRMNWAMYENNAYDDLHKWAQAFRESYGLSKLIRGVYNPVYRLGEFWQTHIWGGSYDYELGDGEFIPTSLPLEFFKDSNKEAIISGLKQVYDWSNWQINKDLVPLMGTILGETFIRVVDDPKKERVYFEQIHPGSILEYEADERGNILNYIIEEERIDPEDQQGTRVVIYTEVVQNKDGQIIYETLRDGKPYPWFNDKTTWTVDYGFTPMVMIQHKNVGKEWGWSEHHSLWTKMMNIDDVATNISDWIRINVNAPWLFSGVSKPKTDKSTSAPNASTNNRYPVKDAMRALYGPVGGTAQPIVSPMDLEGSLRFLEEMLREIERDLPELSMDIWNASKDTSARALRIVRQKTEKKAKQRRAGYDDGLVRLNKMALSIGALGGYKDFDGIKEKSFSDGKLNHFFSNNRPVFVVDELEDLEIEKSFWDAATAATGAGFSLEIWLQRKGWTDEEIKKWKDSEDYKLRTQLRTLALEQPALNPGGDRGGRPDEGKTKEKKVEVK